MTDAQICNLALSYLGQRPIVASINPPDQSTEAQLCAQFYSIALGQMCEMHDWNFITTRSLLALVATEPFDDWAFAYALPSDAASIISVMPQGLYYNAYRGYASYSWLNFLSMWSVFPFETGYVCDYQIENLNGVSVILSNSEAAIARHTTLSTVTGAFSNQFADALARLLASKLAGPILKGDAGAAEGKRQYAAFQVTSGMAAMQDANRSKSTTRFTPSWIAGR